jgi:glyoxylase-like metal-dependent hydrolase (beta-lactamase superfamily II)
MSTAEIWICPACGANFPPADTAPDRCPLCEDERQWVPPTGQRWTTMERLAADGSHSVVREVEPGLTGIACEPGVGVGQRGLLVQTSEGNLLWDPPPFIDDAAIEAVRAAGGVRAVSSSHPHMYGAAVEWSHAFDAEMLLVDVDAGWLMRPDPAVRTWSGVLEVLPGATLIQCGGHFPGSAVAHWAAGADGRGAIFAGDTIFVTPGEDRVSFVYSAPIRLPLAEPAVSGIVRALSAYDFDRIYGGWWSPTIRSEGKQVLERSAQRYIELLTSVAVPPPPASPTDTPTPAPPA